MKKFAAVLVFVAGVVVVRAQLLPPEPQAVPAVAVEPEKDTPEARGKLLYDRYGCAMCHGDDGTGGFDNPNAESEGKVPGVHRVAEGYTEEELIKLVTTGTAFIGRADGTGPVPPYRMPGWSDRLTEDQIRDIVAYLISLFPESERDSWR